MMMQNHLNQSCCRTAFSVWVPFLLLLILAASGTGCAFIKQFPDPAHFPRPVPTPAPIPPTPDAPPIPVHTPKPAPKPKPMAYHAPRVIPTDCPVDGTAKSVRVQTMNESKNRTSEPNHYVFIPIDTILEADRDAYSEDQGIYTEGYIVEIKRSGPESCNCGSHTDTDIHIVLAPSPDDVDNDDKMIVEVTPRLRINMTFTDLKKLELNKTKIRVFGWLFFDAEHIGAKWRGTEWEIHPITDIEVVDEDEGN
jgi:hypothetical protein